jgi:hypothetical protein
VLQLIASSAPRPYAGIDDPPAAPQALGKDKDACERWQRGTAKHSGRQVGRIWIQLLSPRIMTLPQLPGLPSSQKGMRLV